MGKHPPTNIQCFARLDSVVNPFFNRMVRKNLFENEVLAILLVVVLVLVLGLVRDFEDDDENEEDPVMASFSDRFSGVRVKFLAAQGIPGRAIDRPPSRCCICRSR